MTVVSVLLASVLTFGARQERTLTVFAAASLKDAFTEIGKRYESSHPGVEVRLSFAGSQQLAAQIRAGAKVDVFAAAALPQLKSAGRLASPVRNFAQNALTIVVPPDDKQVNGLADVAKVERLVVADPSVPAGAYTVDVLNQARQRFGAPWRALVDRRVVSRETDVRSVLAKVVLGEADAGFVYVSDAHSADGKVRTVPIPDDLNIVAGYPVAVPAGTDQPREAKEFVRFLFTPEAQKVLEGQGFVSPLKPIPELKIIGPQTTRGVIVRQLAALSPVKLRAKTENGETVTYTGASLPKLLDGLGGNHVRFVGADNFTVELPLATVRKNGGVLIQMGDGNVQVVLAGQPQSKWVRWLRRIVVY